MPILAVVIGAIATGLLYWFQYGDGMGQIDRSLRDRRDAKRRSRAEAAYRVAPVRSIRDPVDAAGILMYLVASARGMPTPEQEVVIEAALRAITPADDDLTIRMPALRHAARQVADPETALGHLAPLLRERLTPVEHTELKRMLDAVAAVHCGPVPDQENLIARTVRSLAAAA